MRQDTVSTISEQTVMASAQCTCQVMVFIHEWLMVLSPPADEDRPPNATTNQCLPPVARGRTLIDD